MIQVRDLFWSVELTVAKEGIYITDTQPGHQQGCWAGKKGYLIEPWAEIIEMLHYDVGAPNGIADDSHVTWINGIRLTGAAESCALSQAIQLWKLIEWKN